MIYHIEQVNARTDIQELVVFSTDVTAMYPELDIPEVARIAAEEFLKSGLEVDVDWVELALLLPS